MQNQFFQEGNMLYDRFGRGVTPQQVLGLQDYSAPADPRIFQQAQQLTLPVSTQPISQPMNWQQPRPQQAELGGGRGRSVFSTGTLDFESEGPRKSPEEIEKMGTEHFNKYPDDIPNWINDLNDAGIEIPGWLNDRWEQWLKEYQQKNNQVGRLEIMPQSFIPSLQQTPILQQMTPVLGYLNNIMDVSKGRRF